MLIILFFYDNVRKIRLLPLLIFLLLTGDNLLALSKPNGLPLCNKKPRKPFSLCARPGACMSYDSVVSLVCKHPDDTTLPQLGALHLHIAKRKTPPLAEKTFFQQKHVSITNHP
jgi:hypothetical protein